MKKFQKRLWAGLIVLALLSPLGIILPEKFNAGGAWGEWGSGAVGKMLGYVPKGLAKLNGLWKAPMPDYGFGGDNAPRLVQHIGYIASGLLGIALAGLAVYLLSRLAVNKKTENGK
ncbi:MAG: cobalamin biosynthesis protein [Nitrospirota bacterium]